jgi:hypothetical protein
MSNAGPATNSLPSAQPPVSCGHSHKISARCCWAKTRPRLLDWIRTATQSGVGPVVRFAFGLKSELKPVLAAVATQWSNGQTEGQVNRLKAIEPPRELRRLFWLSYATKAGESSSA